MKKAQTMIEAHDGTKKINEGDMVICIQGNKHIAGHDLMVNLDWSFANDTKPEEIFALLGRFLGNIEDVFGEKMVTEAIIHYAEDNGHLVKTPQGARLHFKSKGLAFKDWKKK